MPDKVNHHQAARRVHLVDDAIVADPASKEVLGTGEFDGLSGERFTANFSIRLRTRLRVSFSSRRRSCSTELLKWTLYGGTFPQPSLHLRKVHATLSLALGDDRQIVQILQELLIVADRQDDGLSAPLAVHHVFLPGTLGLHLRNYRRPGIRLFP